MNYERKEIRLNYILKSSYIENDYRSSLFRGEWVRHQVSDIAKEAIKRKKELFEIIFEGRLQQKEHLPIMLYKFFPFNQNSLKCLENKSVYLNTPENFNDPFDCFIQSNPQEFQKRFVIQKIKEYSLIQKGIIKQEEFQRLLTAPCNSMIHRNKYIMSKDFSSVLNEITYQNGYPRILEEIEVASKKYFEKALKDMKSIGMRVSSFSGFDIWKWSACTEMWGHYADSHRGFCVEYDLSDFILRFENGTTTSEENAIMSSLFPCLYKSTPNFIAPLIFYKYAMGKGFTRQQNINFQKELMYSYIYKSSAWSYEHEWRLILPQKYSEIWNHLIPFPYAKRIYLGVNMPLENKEYMYRLSERLGIEVNDSELDHYKYEISFRTIDVKRYFEDREFIKETKMKNIKLY